MKAYAWLLAGLVAVLLLTVPACDDDDDDDSNSFDDDDNNDLGDDDLVDDDTADDDTGDDDAGDDDIDDDDTEPTELLILGRDADYNYYTYRRTAEEWIAQPIPKPETGFWAPWLGTVQIVEGRMGVGVWNVDGDMTTGYHRWLIYDPEAGWSYDEQRPPAYSGAEVYAMFAPTVDSLWAGSLYFELFIVGSYLYHYAGYDPTAYSLGGSGIMVGAIAFWGEANGYFAGSKGQLQVMKRYDHGTIEDIELPPLARALPMYRLTLYGPDDGYGVLYTNGEKVKNVLALREGQWSQMTAPAGCEDLIPTEAIGDDEQALVFNGLSPNDRFWELRGGQWSCRPLPDLAGEAVLAHATIRRDGCVFAIVMEQIEDEWKAHLYEVTADEFVPVEAPAELVSLYGVFALGAQAPRYGVWRNVN